MIILNHYAFYESGGDIAVVFEVKLCYVRLGESSIASPGLS